MSDRELRATDMRLDMGALSGAVFRHWLRITLLTALLLAAAFAVLQLVPRMYESSASLLVWSGPGAVNPATAEALLASQIELVTSRELLLDVVDEENLRSVPEFSGTGFSPLNALLQLAGRKPDPVSVDETTLRSLKDRVTVTRDAEPGKFSIHVNSADAALAARIANAVATAIVKRSGTLPGVAASEANAEIARQRDLVQQADAAVLNYKVDNDIPVDTGATSINEQIAAARQRKDAAQSQADLIRGLISSGQSLEAVGRVRQSVVMQQLLQSRASLQGDLVDKSATLLANHPKIKALKAQISQVERQIAIEGQRVAASLDAEAAVEIELEAKLRGEQARANATPAASGPGLESLQSEAKAQRALLDDYLKAASNTASDNAPVPPVRVVSEAIPNLQPVSPKVLLILGVVGIGALALQIGGILFGALISGAALVERHSMSAEVADSPDMAQTDGADAHPAEEGAGAELIELDEAAFAAAFDEPEEAADAAEPVQAPAPVADELLLLADEIAAGALHVLFLAGLSDHGECLPVAGRLAGEMLDRGLSAVEIDAGSGTMSVEAGLTDLAGDRAEFGDVLQRLDDNLAEVPWGRLPAIDRRSLRPATLVEALADIYHLVIVNTGRIGVTSSLPVFAGGNAALLLVTDDLVPAGMIDAACRDATALGFAVRGVIEVPTLRSEVA